MASRTEEIRAKFERAAAPEGSPDTRTQTRFDEIGRRVSRRIQDLRDQFLGIDRRFDRSGVQDFTFRMDFSRQDTQEEREAFLNDHVGKKGWTRDKFSHYALTPAGMDTLQLEHAGRPVLVDEPKLTRFDIADLRGDAPAIAGGTLAGIATGGAGFGAGVAATAAGAALGKGADEVADAFRGDNLQSPGEIFKDLGREALFSAGGETFSRGVMLPLGRKLMAPEAKRVTPEVAEITDDALAIGVKPNVSQITRAPILGRTQSMMNRIFGDPLAARNSAALGREMGRLASEAGAKISKRTSLGELVETNIKAARRAFGVDSNAMFQLFDDVVGGRPIVPTARLKGVAEQILNEMPRTVKGRQVFVAPETVDQIGATLELPDFITGKQMQAIRNRLFDASRVTNLVPGIEVRHARMLRRAASKAFGDTRELSPEFIARHFDVDLGTEAAEKMFGEGGPQQLVLNAVKSLDEASAFYREGVAKFDNNLISRITRDESFAGSIDPETIVDTVFRKGRSTGLKRVMAALPERVQGNVRRTAMEDLLNTLRDDVSDPLVSLFDGKNFNRTLHAYGEETLDAMFGEARRKELFKFAKVAQLATQRQALSGGLVAAHIALHPLRNVSRLVRLRILSGIMNSDAGLKWLTTGFEAPNTRAGAAALTRLGAQINAQLIDEKMKEVDF